MSFPQYKVIRKEVNDGGITVQFSLMLTAELDYFDGHFENMPILPAVAQLFMVNKLAEKYTPINGGFTALRQLKFKSPITPNDEIKLTISYLRSRGQLTFEYSAMEQLKSKGTLVYQLDEVA